VSSLRCNWESQQWHSYTPWGTIVVMVEEQQLHDMDAEALRALAAGLIEQLTAKDKELHFKQARIDQLTHEMAVLKRLKFAARSERFDAQQRSLLEETLDADLAALEEELQQLSEQNKPQTKTAPVQPRRAPLPAQLPRVEIRHEPESELCGCGCRMKRIGEDVAEKLDYQPGVFTVERHVRGKWSCGQCRTLVQAPVPAHVIDKGIPTSGLLAQVLVAKYAPTCRCTGRKASLLARGWPYRALRWRSGWASAAYNCSRWSMP